MQKRSFYLNIKMITNYFNSYLKNENCFKTFLFRVKLKLFFLHKYGLPIRIKLFPYSWILPFIV